MVSDAQVIKSSFTQPKIHNLQQACYLAVIELPPPQAFYGLRAEKVCGSSRLNVTYVILKFHTCKLLPPAPSRPHGKACEGGT